jgi:ABC-2 type transport system permease protein
MKRFMGFVRKEFYHIIRDTRSMLILFVLPVIQLLIFGYVVSNELKDIKVVFLDKSNDMVTRELREKILASGYFLDGGYLDNDSQVEKVFRQGSVKEVIVFEPDFAGRLQRDGVAGVQLIADASDANTANLIVNYTSGIIIDYIRKLNADNVMKSLAEPAVRMYFNPELKSVYMFVPGTMALILILVSAMMTSISIAREKELGTMEALLVSPLRPSQIVLGKVTPYVVLSFVNAVSIIAVGYYIFGVPVRGSTTLLLAETMLYILLSLSLGILISTLTSRQQVAMFLSMFALLLPTMLLSGFIFPIENMPRILQWFTYVVPPRYFIVIIKDIMLKGAGFMDVWHETAVLAGMTVFFIGLSILKFRIRLE